MHSNRSTPSWMICLLLILCFGLAQSKPQCKPQVWTQFSNYLKFGSCNWPNDDSPCGKVVTPKGERAWPFGACALKFSTTPWAPETYPQEQSNTWMCGTNYMICKKRNSTEEIICGSNVVGTKVVCPNEQDDRYTCTPKTQVFNKSNCKGSTDDLVVEVNTMGYPELIKDRRMTKWEECDSMCGLRAGCNMWVFCNSTEGCGFSCQDYYNKVMSRKGLPKAALVGIIVGSAVVGLLIVSFIVYRFVFRPRHHPYKSNLHQHNVTPGQQAVSINATNPLQSHPMGTAILGVSNEGITNAAPVYQGQPVMGQVAVPNWQMGVNGPGGAQVATGYATSDMTGPRRTGGADHAIW